jgi:CheY-like chemotaxis protein
MDEHDKKTILIVDDVETNIDVLVGMLDPMFNVSVAMNGTDALQLAENDPPSLILLDIMMPGIDGYEVCRRLKTNELTKHIPVIFVSAKGEIDDKMDGYEVGGVGYITKPVDSEFALQTINTTLEKRDKYQNG